MHWQKPENKEEFKLQKHYLNIRSKIWRKNDLEVFQLKNAT